MIRQAHRVDERIPQIAVAPSELCHTVKGERDRACVTKRSEAIDETSHRAFMLIAAAEQAPQTSTQILEIADCVQMNDHDPGRMRRTTTDVRKRAHRSWRG